MNLLDIFCGCGGFSLGARQAGFNTTLAIDVDPILSFPYLTNFPGSRLLLADVSKLASSHLRTYVGRIDGIFGGPPCQGFSSIGLRKKNDPRRTLLFDFFRMVAELKPAFFVMENVPGLGQAEASRLLEKAMELVVKHYNLLGPIILDAANYGAATKRPRLFVVGMNKSYAEPLHIEDIKKHLQPAATVRDAISDLHDARFVRETDGYDVWSASETSDLSEYAKSVRSENGEFTGHSVTAHTSEVRKRFSKILQGEVDPIGRHHRLAWDGQCSTLRAGTGSDKGSYQSVRPIHPDQPRVITVREAARLQGFPDSFRFHPTTWHSFRMIGNSVSPVMSRAIFSAVAKKIEISPQQVAAE